MHVPATCTYVYVRAWRTKRTHTSLTLRECDGSVTVGDKVECEIETHDRKQKEQACNVIAVLFLMRICGIQLNWQCTG